MQTLYARLEPTTDPTMLKYDGPNPRSDVVIYGDEAATTQKARFPWWFSNRPDRRFRYITLNCHRQPLCWLPSIAA